MAEYGGIPPYKQSIAAYGITMQGSIHKLRMTVGIIYHAILPWHFHLTTMFMSTC
ncbi:hypothetical protein JHK87_027511 [Glycine soja]|nr:hypothetical protein JHK87_027511 [Glycine soja]KAG5003611.1 hypothetical protein JHK86_027750 [Glycine max]